LLEAVVQTEWHIALMEFAGHHQLLAILYLRKIAEQWHGMVLSGLLEAAGRCATAIMVLLGLLQLPPLSSSVVLLLGMDLFGLLEGQVAVVEMCWLTRRTV
jgi:hypothetical protein